MTGSEPASARRRKADQDRSRSLERPEDLLLTTAQVAAMLHVVPKVVINLVQQGRLKAHRIPGMRQYLFWREEIFDLIEASVVKPDDMDAEDTEKTVTGAE